MVAFLLCSGAMLLALGVIAEYVGVAVSMAMGKPLYLIVSDPADGPLGRGRVDPTPPGTGDAPSEHQRRTGEARGPAIIK
jgi:undecaprenyl-phosphate 4-deoxy-4-formamido-L-arabinose transferase